jgi:hypothetical protein
LFQHIDKKELTAVIFISGQLDNFCILHPKDF